MTLTASFPTTSAHLSAVLVDLGPRPSATTRAPARGSRRSAPGPAGAPAPPATAPATWTPRPYRERVGATVFSRGYDLGHYDPSLIGVTLTPGARTPSPSSWPSDHVVPAGHRLALIVAGTDNGLIVGPGSTPKITLDLTHSSANLPVVGGSAVPQIRAGC